MEWQLKTMADIAEPVNGIVDGPFGSSLKKSDYIDDSENGIPVLTTKNLHGDYSKDSVRYISTEKYETLKRSTVFPGDILVAKIGSIGTCGIYPLSCKNALIPANLLKITVLPTVDRKYVYYYIQSRGFQEKIKAISTATAQPAFNVTKFRKLHIPIPPLQEQKRIVARIEELFSQLDAGVETLKKTKAQLAVYRQAVFASIIGKYDGAERTLSDVAITVDGDRGKNYPKKEEFAKEGYCLFLTAANVRPYGWAFEDNTFISKEKDSILHGGRLERDDIVITTRGTLGNVAVYDNTVPYESVRINSCMLIVRVTDDAVSPYYLAQYLMSPMFKYQVAKLKSGTAQPQIPANVLREIPLKIPTINIQAAIIDELTEEFSVCDSIEQTVDAALQQAEAMRQSILKDAFEGRL